MINKKVYKCCIFDLDGTLINSVKAMTYSVNLTLKENNLGFINDEIGRASCRERV